MGLIHSDFAYNTFKKGKKGARLLLVPLLLSLLLLLLPFSVQWVFWLVYCFYGVYGHYCWSRAFSALLPSYTARPVIRNCALMITFLLHALLATSLYCHNDASTIKTPGPSPSSSSASPSPSPSPSSPYSFSKCVPAALLFLASAGFQLMSLCGGYAMYVCIGKRSMQEDYLTPANSAAFIHSPSSSSVPSSSPPSPPSVSSHGMDGIAIEMQPMSSTKHSSAQTSEWSKSSGSEMREGRAVVREAAYDGDCNWRTYSWMCAMVIAFMSSWGLLSLFSAFQIRVVQDSTILSLVSVFLFQLLRTTFVHILISINRQLPTRWEVQHLGEYFQLLFFLYYRTLFINTSGWDQIVGMACVSLAVSLLCYPLLLSTFFYTNVFERIQNIVIHSPTRYIAMWKWLFHGTRSERELSYETHVTRVCVRYFFEEMAEYYSTVIFLSASFVLLLSSNQHLYSYLSISTEDFIQLLYVYLFLFLFELSTDICTRLFVYVVLNIDISGEATFRTVGNKETRALLAHFNLYIILSVYLSLTAIE